MECGDHERIDAVIPQTGTVLDALLHLHLDDHETAHLLDKLRDARHLELALAHPRAQDVVLLVLVNRRLEYRHRPTTNDGRLLEERRLWTVLNDDALDVELLQELRHVLDQVLTNALLLAVLELIQESNGVLVFLLHQCRDGDDGTTELLPEVDAHIALALVLVLDVERIIDAIVNLWSEESRLRSGEVCLILLEERPLLTVTDGELLVLVLELCALWLLVADAIVRNPQSDEQVFGRLVFRVEVLVEPPLLTVRG